MNMLQKKRQSFLPLVPPLLRNLAEVRFYERQKAKEISSQISSLFPKTGAQKAEELGMGKGENRKLRIGVFFSGGQAPGGHNVITGIWDAIREMDPSSELIGFLDGPSGLIEKKYRVLKSAEIDAVRNMGGFDLIGSGRTKIETLEQMSSSLQTCLSFSLDGLIVIGGDDSNTNAAILAEYFLQEGCKTKVIGVPKTIDGDLRSEEIEISFGFDSACKTYAEMIGNIGKDALSARKYYHFIKLMGRSASHIALECALATHPNLVLIGEEQKGLEAIVKEIADLICKRKEAGKEFGIVLIPEGLIEFIPEMKSLIAELNQCLLTEDSKAVQERLSSHNKALFSSLPEKIRTQLLFDRDSHGNVALSQIETEFLLIELVKNELKKRPSYTGHFHPISHFFGYEGRACYPSNFDANYCYTLGKLAAVAVRDERTGFICAVQHLKKSVDQWKLSLVPIVQLMHMEERKGKQKPVIRKALVDLQGAVFTHFCKQRKGWEMDDAYCSPGPIQFFGDNDLVNATPLILQ